MHRSVIFPKKNPVNLPPSSLFFETSNTLVCNNPENKKPPPPLLKVDRDTFQPKFWHDHGATNLKKNYRCKLNIGRTNFKKISRHTKKRSSLLQGKVNLRYIVTFFDCPWQNSGKYIFQNCFEGSDRIKATLINIYRTWKVTRLQFSIIFLPDLERAISVYWGFW